MNSMMETNWNAVVKPEDKVFYLGDFAMHPSIVLEVLPKLNGSKILIAGNHDKCHGGSEKWIEHYMEAGFASIQNQMNLEIAGKEVLLHHFPYRSEKAEPDQKHYNFRPIDKGGWLIHGHVHQRWKMLKKQINVSVDPWNFKPVNINEIAKLIKNGPAEIDVQLSKESS